MAGLHNPNNILAPSPVTHEQVSSEYEQRDSFPEDTAEEIAQRSLRYLSAGQFEMLRNWLLDLQAQYKIRDGDEQQGKTNVEYVIESLLTDLQATLNLEACDQPSEILRFYSSSEVLAAAIAYTPISVKYNSFIDWSAILVPAVSKTDNLYLRDVTPSHAASILKRINDLSPSARYLDIKIYEMVLYGYQFRLTCVMNEFGYYQPYTLKSSDGYYANGPTYSDIVAFFSTKDPKVSIDEVIHLKPLTEAEKQKVQLEHPEYVSPADGYYLGEDGLRDDCWEIGLSREDWDIILS
ncbi:MAG: hypothetical protein IKC03_00435 [Oscillospiraceae bacterium]|nr:hypothetical protein [Oscillospiraceae bacterium]